MKSLKFYTYIYTDIQKEFIDSFAEPFYIGKGSSDRAFVHLKGAVNKHLDNKVKKMIRNNNPPNIEIIETTNEISALWLERCFISSFGRKDLNTGPLLNNTDGGEGVSGFKHSLETKQKLKNIGKNSGFKKGHTTNNNRKPWNTGLKLGWGWQAKNRENLK